MMKFFNWGLKRKKNEIKKRGKIYVAWIHAQKQHEEQISTVSTNSF